MDIESKIRDLERQMFELQQVIKGVNVITQGWNGEQLTVSDLQFTTRQPWNVVPLLNGWGNYIWLGVPPTILEGGIVVRRLDHRVILSVSITGGVILGGTLVSTLPFTKYFPRSSQWMPVMTSGGAGILTITTDGNITCFQVPANGFVVGTFIYLADT